MDTADVTGGLEGIVTVLQTVVAGVLVLLLAVGVLNLGVLVVSSAASGEIVDLASFLGLIVSSIDVVLYLFVVVELYKTIIAYVRAESVVIAVIHAGLIAVVRQIITFKPEDAGGPSEAILVAATNAALLLALLVGFVVVHRRIDEDEGA